MDEWWRKNGLLKGVSSAQPITKLILTMDADRHLALVEDITVTAFDTKLYLVTTRIKHDKGKLFHKINARPVYNMGWGL